MPGELSHGSWRGSGLLFFCHQCFCQKLAVCLAVQNRFSKPKWKVEWKIDGNNFPLGRLGTAKIVGKIAHWLSRKWNFLSTTKNSEWKIGKVERSPTVSQLRHSEHA
jgi:hypothetical protein